ncbi:Mo-dependent nitrogenase C-terminal domain-containing protein [Oscillatoria sp. FACHB-1407]|uniref:Mo-dependent nitrogenase C-terminal domain-containing protein n=1 Tax=Oscillatoria sp. FACHB-1407 TaxID=2692847 RepID=UPI001687A80D|nr:Mo-dependent nitrogenase C-terminal domain-containing protein [Oscillatoria sp. FACHB-1407]MBD2459891.1 Mo-dependent nitrogenase C-terminal domain-containing protein [Oscillatoria sp. FACHB-1407]
MATASSPHQNHVAWSLIALLRQWLNHIEIRHASVAHLICRVIPSHCPFERDINLFGCWIVHIPAFCKINPLYDELISLRFRALTYLADVCHQDVSVYIH